jgi:hypothetical protein
VSDVLESIARHSAGLLSATETIRAEQARVDDLVTLIDQYGDVAERANTVRFDQLVHRTLPGAGAASLTSSESWGAVNAALTRAETQGLDAATVLWESWSEREHGTAEDVGAVLSYRMERRLEAAPAIDQAAELNRPAVPAWIADRRALDSPGTDPAWREHLAERYEYLSVRLEERGASVVAERPTWAQQLGDVPAEGAPREEWVRLAAEVAVFRDRCRVDPAQADAIPAAYRERAVGAELAARVAAQNQAQAPSILSTTADAGRQTPPTALEAMRAANRTAADRQREAQRAAGLTVTARHVIHGDQAAQQADDQRSRDDGRER